MMESIASLQDLKQVTRASWRAWPASHASAVLAVPGCRCAQERPMYLSARTRT
jgi:hypothetical protein